MLNKLFSFVQNFLYCDKSVIRESIFFYDDMVEARDDPISKLLTILPKLKRKPLQIQWDIKVFGVDTFLFLFTYQTH